MVVRFRGFEGKSFSKEKTEKKESTSAKAGGAGVSRFLKKKFDTRPLERSRLHLSWPSLQPEPSTNFFFKTRRA
jgi:hypothetical protein